MVLMKCAGAEAPVLQTSRVNVRLDGAEDSARPLPCSVACRKSSLQEP